MDDMLKYENIKNEDRSNPNISEAKRNLMIDYIRYADKNDIELTMEQIDFKFTLLSPDAVSETSKNYGMPVGEDSVHSKWIITVAVSGDEGYDIFKAAEELDYIWWTRSKATRNIKENDLVYMYVGKPYSKIMYKFECTAVDENLSFDLNSQDEIYWNNPEMHTKGNKDCFRLSKLQYIDDDNLSLNKLNELGYVKTRIQGSFKSDNNPELFEYIEMQFSKARKKRLYFENDAEYDVDVNNDVETVAVADVPQKKLNAELVNGSFRYKRDPRIGRYAIECSDYKCEVDGTHRTFISRGSDKPYLEAHHLIPISAQDKFEYSLDVPANIVALCSTCHNEIHYGRDAEQLIRKLYGDRCERLHKAGINISINKLLEMYNL